MDQSLLSHCLSCRLWERKAYGRITRVVVIVFIFVVPASLCAALPPTYVMTFAALLSAISGAVMLLHRVSQKECKR